MAVTFADGLRACCVAVGLLLVAARAAEPVSPLIGVTRDQLLSRYGEPRSQMTAGSRVVYIYPRERIVLRDDVVVEVEQLSASPASETTTSAPSTPPTVAAPNDSATPGPRATTPAPQTLPAPDSKVEIKLVRPPSKDGRPVTPEPSKSPVVSTPSPPEPGVPKSTPSPTSVPPEVVPSLPKKADKQSQSSSIAKIDSTSDEQSKLKKAEELAAKKKKEEAVRAARRRMEEAAAADTTTPGLGGQTYLLALVVVVGGAGLLYWRYRQRQFVLAATSVSSTPLTTTAAPAFTGAGFTAEELGKLEWKRFEELVTAYYIKTGVVAARTKTGPDGPVQIKISWKGEPRPFAYVRCIAHPNGLIDPKPLHALVATLAADDIRRGYVVTSGKFNVQARDFAEEKHITLLPGDIFLEKLNALPAAARAEIMQSITASDSAAPSCPKCDAKMVRSTDGTGSWRCPSHADQVIPIQK